MAVRQGPNVLICMPIRAKCQTGQTLGRSELDSLVEFEHSSRQWCLLAMWLFLGSRRLFDQEG
jgi:hypothetical protein